MKKPVTRNDLAGVVCRTITKHTRFREVPEVRLWLAVVTRAIWMILTARNGKSLVVGQCRDWLAGKGFEEVADDLGLNAEWVRGLVAAAQTQCP